MKKRKRKKFKRGTVVVWTPDNFNQKWWKGLSEEDRIKYYGVLGYGKDKPELFVFLTEIRDSYVGDTGHCVLVSLRDQHVETMRHTDEFRAARDDEF